MTISPNEAPLERGEPGRVSPDTRRGDYGMAWWYRKYAPGDAALEGLEKDAREARKGLWADLQPVPPWEGRKRSR
jgi:hypothetical protein